MSGVLVDGGFVDKGSTWSSGTSTVTAWVPVKSETLTEGQQLTHSEALGQVSQYSPEQNRIAVEGDLVTELDYNYGHGLLEYALGAEAAGTYDTADQLPYFGLELDKGVQRWRYSSCCVNRLTITGTTQGIIEVTYGLVAYQESRSATAFPAVRPAASAQERVIFEDVAVWLGTVAGGALSGADVVGVTGFELTLENNMQVDVSDSTSSKRVLNPVRNGFRTGSLRLDFPRYVANLESGGGTFPLDTWRDSNTELQAQLTFTGSTGTFTVYCPIAHMTDGGNAPVSGPDVIPESLSVELNGGVNANMAGVDQLRLVAA